MSKIIHGKKTYTDWLSGNYIQGDDGRTYYGRDGYYTETKASVRARGGDRKPEEQEPKPSENTTSRTERHQSTDDWGDPIGFVIKFLLVLAIVGLILLAIGILFFWVFAGYQDIVVAYQENGFSVGYFLNLIMYPYMIILMILLIGKTKKNHHSYAKHFVLLFVPFYIIIKGFIYQDILVGLVDAVAFCVTPCLILIVIANKTITNLKKNNFQPSQDMGMEPMAEGDGKKKFDGWELTLILDLAIGLPLNLLISFIAELWSNDWMTESQFVAAGRVGYHNIHLIPIFGLLIAWPIATKIKNIIRSRHKK